MDKTPGMIVDAALAQWPHTLHVKWEHATDEWRAHCEIVAAAVIAHATPSIEAEARAAAITDAFNAAWDLSKCTRPEYDDVCVAIRSIAAAPAGFVCVPIEPTQKMLESAWAILASPQGEAVALIYKAMLAARPQ
jgi:hypothetical protein